MAVISFAAAALIVVGLVFFGVVFAFEIAYRARNRAFKPEVQLQRAGLGNYPTWRK